ncbi:MAG: HlyD family efflux transporter periplasmic adaptor subunit [Lewinellaceae bacterium]|nr:HlyD family efflux transporter periplasmic adaptor subunit [Saprospiraceae bacterium]MCB9329700.1 HlyD family efflux transporter periplasmic adaptor subunit [Lewinellaceae bacterium]
MEEREYIELRSEEVQEILGTPPGWLVRWGTLVVFLCITALLSVAAIISYPDVIEAKVLITTTVPPVDVVARTDGHIVKFFAQDKAAVKQGTILAVLESTADYEDILRLEEQVARWQQYGADSLNEIRVLQNLNIGEVQSDYSAFVQDVSAYRFGKQDKSPSIQQNIGSINRQIDKLEQSIQYDQRAKVRIQSQLSTAKERYQKQRELFDAGLISEVELENEKNRVDDLERQIDALDESVLRKQNDIINLGKNRNDVSFSGRQDEASIVSRLRQSLNSLQASIDKWKQTYLLTAPIDGRVSLNATYFSAKQFVKQGDQVLVIVPPKSDKIVGRLLLPVAGSGKVLPGQRVILKLDSYPYYEFGTLRGQVISKSLVPRDNKYAILVYLPDGLKTSYNREIPFEQQLQGSAEIITEEKRFLQRIYEQVFAARH